MRDGRGSNGGEDSQFGHVGQVLHAMQHPVRREIVRCLHRCDEDVTLTELADAVADADVGGDPSKREMYHVHLPILDECGLVEYSPETRLVAAGGQFEDAVILLNAIAVIE